MTCFFFFLLLRGVGILHLFKNAHLDPDLVWPRFNGCRNLCSASMYDLYCC